MSVVAINPAAQLPHKTLFHELGHQVLGHVSEGERGETETLSRNLEEAEAVENALAQKIRRRFGFRGEAHVDEKLTTA